MHTVENDSAESRRRHLSGRLDLWADGPVKDAIVEFLFDVTAGPGALPVEERIAAFDNDGTVQCEKPHMMVTEFFSAMAESRHGRVASMVRRAPGPLGAVAPRALGTLASRRDDIDVHAFADRARHFIAERRHPRFGSPYPQVAYTPMLQLIDLLHELEFAVYLVTGGSRDLLRIYAPEHYGVPLERVIGSEVRVAYRAGRLRRTTVPLQFAFGKSKVVLLWEHSGRLPVFAAGNTASDIPLLECARFALVLDHDDAEREYAYHDDALLAEADREGWHVAHMQHDFVEVFDSPAS